jgi:hypothetical protein
MLNQTNEWRRDFSEEAKGHGALAARTAGWVSLQNTASEYSPYHKNRAHSAVRLNQCFSTAGPRPGTGPGINYTGSREFVILVF